MASPEEVIISPKSRESVRSKASHVSQDAIPTGGSRFRSSKSFRTKRAASPAVRNFQKNVKHAQLLLNASSKVAEENKIGEPPQGWFRDMALSLQTGIASEAVTKVKSSCSDGPVFTEFKAAEPDLFARARAACGISPARYVATMGLQEGQAEPSLRLVGTSAASGKSGAFFLLSPDQQCIAKSCTVEDWNTLLKILPAYVERLEDARKQAGEKTNRRGSNATELSDVNACSGFMETLLPRYLGLYTLVGDTKEDVRVLVMANVFGGSRAIGRRYDLKGSTVGREASKKELAKASPVLKDKDWVKKEEALVVAEDARRQIFEALEDDVRCLQAWGLMDYSLLLGIHDIKDSDGRSSYEAMNVVYLTTTDKTRLCYIGIVDILTPYGWRKWAETLLRGRLQCGSDVSCQHPRYYGERFMRFVRESVFSS